MGSGDLSFKIAISAIDFKSLQGFSWYFNHVVGDYVSYEMIKDLGWVVKLVLGDFIPIVLLNGRPSRSPSLMP